MNLTLPSTLEKKKNLLTLCFTHFKRSGQKTLDMLWGMIKTHGFPIASQSLEKWRMGFFSLLRLENKVFTSKGRKG